MTAKASGKVQEDHERARVTLWSFPSRGETGFHRHELDYVVVPLTSSPLKIVDMAGKESISELTAGVSYFRRTGVEHDVINASDDAFAFVEVEFK
jgi:quercetin dioxygenase-like cupin family protein